MEFESQRYAFELSTLPLEGAPEVPVHDLILFFHRMIQDKALAETCIDVADYSHVPGGPGVLLVCHEAQYTLHRGALPGDPAPGLLSLKCATKRGAEGDTRARIRRVLKKAFRAAALAETHPVLGGRVRFDTTRAVLSIEDRLIAPNETATFRAIMPHVADVIHATWGAHPVLTFPSAPKECFQIVITTPIGPSIEELLSRL